MVRAMLLVIVLWVAWCAVHSLLVTDGVRRMIERKGGRGLRCYRLGYVVFSTGSLLALLWYTATLPQQSISLSAGWIRVVQLLLGFYALVMFVGGLQVYDLQWFLGIRQWRDFQAGQTGEPPCFVQTGILQYVRHPWYSGGIALLWSLPGLTDVSLAVRVLLSAYLIVGTLLEERKLRQHLGERYRMYCQEVPMLVPWKRHR